MKRVCFDSMVLIWGVQGNETQVERGMVDRTRAFLKSLEEKGREKSTVFVPAPSLSEFLCGIPADERPAAVRSIHERFVVADFDAAAAALATEIWTKRAQVVEPGDRTVKRVMKVDCQILAIALKMRAEVLYTDDKWLLGAGDLVDGRLRIETVPAVEIQEELPFGREPANGGGAQG